MATLPAVSGTGRDVRGRTILSMVTDGALALLVAIAFPVVILLVGAPFVLIGHLVAALFRRF
jgi:hypothetical protein